MPLRFERHREKIRVSGFLIQETEKAYLLKSNKVVAWVPKAVCEELGRKKRGIVLLMERWMAEKKFGKMKKGVDRFGF